MTLVVCLVALTACGSSSAENPGGVVIRQTSDADGFIGSTVPYALPDITLTATDGQSFNLATDTASPVTLFFFGYTSCPDVCGTVMATISSSLRKVDPAVRPQVQVVYVTTDPARDTPQVIGKYLEAYDFPSVVGLTGSIADIEPAALALGVEITDGKSLPGGGYEVGHSAHVIGFGAGATEPVVWTEGTGRDDMAHDIDLLAAA